MLYKYKDTLYTVYVPLWLSEKSRWKVPNKYFIRNNSKRGLPNDAELQITEFMENIHGDFLFKSLLKPMGFRDSRQMRDQCTNYHS